MKEIPELDIIIKTHDKWTQRIFSAEAAAYQISLNSDMDTTKYRKLRDEYVQYILDKLIYETEVKILAENRVI